jgi:AraC-like DNA-binding protein
VPTAIEPNVIENTDAYKAAVKGATVEAVRFGEGSAPNVVIGVPGERVTVTSSEVGFPILTRSQIDEGHLAATHIETVGESSRWCGVPLHEGMVILYGPGVEHMAVNRPGLRFTFGITKTYHLDEVADRLGKSITRPGNGEVVVLDNPDVSRRLGAALSEHTHTAVGGGATGRTGDEVLRCMTAILGDDSATIDSRRGLDSKKVVRCCLDYAEVEGRIPSLEELCRASSVSERRLRSAFTEEFDCPPTAFMRAWALDTANRRLREADPYGVSVTEVAADLGFNHLGRFAGQYRSVFGESPSLTLRRTGEMLVD